MEAEEKKGTVCTLMMLALLRGLAGPGLTTSMGVFFPYIADELGYGLGALSFTVSIASLAGAVFLPLAGKLYARFDIRRVTGWGICLIAPAFAALGFSHRLWVWYLLAIPFGCGMVLLVNLMTPLYTERLFPGERGSYLGLLMAGAGLVGAVVQPILAFWLSAYGWRRAYLLLGGSAFLLMGAGLFFLPHLPGEEHSGGQDGEGGPSREISAGALASVPPGGASAAGAFWTLFLYQGIITGYSMFHQHFSTFHRAAGLPAWTLGWSLGLSMGGAAAGAILLGMLTRRHGAVMTGGGVLLLGGVSVALFLAGAGHPWVFLLACILHGVASAAIGVTVPALALEVFPQGQYGRRLSRIMISAPLATVLFMQLFGFLYDRSGTYVSALWFLLLALWSTLFIWLCCFAHEKKMRPAHRIH